MASAYSPRLRTALVLCGAGTAGAYHAGVLRAFAEAGVKVDVVAGQGAGVVGALAGAVDGGQALWGPSGPWSSWRLGRAYRWRPALRWAGLGLGVALAVLIAPLGVILFATLAYLAGLFAGLVSLPNISEWLVDFYRRTIVFLFHPPVVPTVVPRLVVLALLVVAGVLIVEAIQSLRGDPTRRRFRGAFWWHLIGLPLDAGEPGLLMTEALWTLSKGASNEPRPPAADIGRRYVDLLLDNLGQPGFREVLIVVHDVDARRDLAAAVLAPETREAFGARRATGGPREAEAVDLTGSMREMLVDFAAAAWRLPVVSPAQAIVFPGDHYWRGECHRVCDRPELISRLIDEVAGVGVEQVVLVSAAAPAAVPHGIRPRPVDMRGRIGDMCRSIETSALQDAWSLASTRFSGAFMIRPDHNPIGPFDFAGAYDDASDRQTTVADLMKQGYDDAYRQFIEPVVASGERVES